MMKDFWMHLSNSISLVSGTKWIDIKQKCILFLSTKILLINSKNINSIFPNCFSSKNNADRAKLYNWNNQIYNLI